MQANFSRPPVTGQVHDDYVWNSWEWAWIKPEREDAVLKKLNEILERLERLERQARP